VFNRIILPELEPSFPVVAKNVTVAVGHQKLVDDASLRVDPGEFVAVMGPSGSGKSSLINVLCNLTADKKPPSGEMWYGDPNNGGVEIYTHPQLQTLRARRRFVGQHVGFVPQLPMLRPELTVDQNIRRILDYKRLPYDAAYIGGLAVLLGMADKMNKSSRVLSGGEKQRAGIIVGMAHNPSVLVMDEPTSDYSCSNP
jgi:putative ABC transport system ATP-binding protein